MSSAIWTPAALSSELHKFAGSGWRFVEAQHKVSTLKLVDSLAEQELLEQIVEETKPAIRLNVRGSTTCSQHLFATAHSTGQVRAFGAQVLRQVSSMRQSGKKLPQRRSSSTGFCFTRSRPIRRCLQMQPNTVPSPSNWPPAQLSILPGRHWIVTRTTGVISPTTRPVRRSPMRPEKQAARSYAIARCAILNRA